MSKIDFLYIPDLLEVDRSISSLGMIYEKDKLKPLLASIILNNEEFKGNISGKTILLKPNWVLHPENSIQDICLISHHEVLFATLELLLELNPKKLIIGDAPLQRCNWDKLLTSSFYETIDCLNRDHLNKIEIIDFRRVVLDSRTGKISKNLRPIEDYIIFDLKDKSNLEPISSDKNIFRVTEYDPRRLGTAHKKGIHKYCITKKLFEVDTVLTMSKFKTHQKAGITNALKILVGINGDKAFLPHHRIGGTKTGGDCYPGFNPIRRTSEFFMDHANIHRGNVLNKILKKVSHALWKIAGNSSYYNLSAAWYGNDTTWRMVLDLYLIALCGNSSGEIAPKPVRKLYNLTDGIIGGEGDGPLKPEPFPLGFLSFSDDSFLTDLLYSKLAGIDSDKIPLIKEGLRIWGLSDYELRLNNIPTKLNAILKHSIKAKPPPGWVDRF